MTNATGITPGQTSMPASTPATATTSAAPASAASGSTKWKRPSKLPVKMIIAAIVLLLLILGGIAAFFLSRQNQDVRQQASTGVATPGCSSTCTSNTQCPSNHTCSAGKCVLSVCLQSGVTCDAAKCVQTGVPACSLNFIATDAPPPQISCIKTAYRDEFSNTAGNYQLLQEKSTFAPGDTVVFRINSTNNGQATTQISLTDPLTGNNLDNFTFVDSNCGANAYNAATKTLTCPAADVTAGESLARIFRVKLSSTVANGTVLTNTANIAAGTVTANCSVPVTIAVASPSPSPSPSVSPSPSPTTYICNGPCTTDEQCRTVNAGYICSAADGNRCRLDSNRGSATCTPAVSTYTCNSACTTNAQCQTANSSYICSEAHCRLDSNPTATSCLPSVYVPPTPVVGCNITCSTNADCSASNHICADTSTGRRCRLDNYPNSETCTPPDMVYRYTAAAPTPAASTQPELPPELPRTGAGDNVVKFLLIGAIAVILGALGLLLL